MTNKQASVRTFYVVRVDGDPRDTHAGETLREALDLAMPDDGTTVEYGTVEACDAGAARLMEPVTWKRTGVRVDEDGNDLDHPGVTWSHYDVDPYTRECECEGPECDPDTCPRMGDTCEECGATFSSGWVCLDGGECACDECVTVVPSTWDERKARNTARTSTEGGAS